MNTSSRDIPAPSRRSAPPLERHALARTEPRLRPRCTRPRRPVRSSGPCRARATRSLTCTTSSTTGAGARATTSPSPADRRHTPSLASSGVITTVQRLAVSGKRVGQQTCTPVGRSFSETQSPLLVVDIPSMSKPHNDHQQHVVLDRVDDAVIADPDTKTRPTLKHTCTRRARMLGEQSDRTLDPTANLRVELAQRPDCPRAKLDAIRAHSQPRSALTCSQGMLGPSSAIAASKAATSSTSSRAVISCS